MVVVGLDPGYEKSAYVQFGGVSVGAHQILPNLEMLELLKVVKASTTEKVVLVVEQISMGGMVAGAEIFETCFWTGRFIEVWDPRRWDRVKRKDVKVHLCNSVRATDSNIRQNLIDRFGPTTEKAIGNKKHPGPLYGIKSHEWAALAVAVTWLDRHGHEDPIRPGVNAEF